METISKYDIVAFLSAQSNKTYSGYFLNEKGNIIHRNKLDGDIFSNLNRYDEFTYEKFNTITNSNGPELWKAIVDFRDITEEAVHQHILNKNNELAALNAKLTEIHNKQRIGAIYKWDTESYVRQMDDKGTGIIIHINQPHSRTIEIRRNINLKWFSINTPLTIQTVPLDVLAIFDTLTQTYEACIKSIEIK